MALSWTEVKALLTFSSINELAVQPTEDARADACDEEETRRQLGNRQGRNF